MTKEQASKIFLVKEKCLKRFDVIDSFNEPNRLEGWISLKPDFSYGSLIIDTINGIEVPYQYVRGMPKLHYPFRVINEKREYFWPEDWTEVEVLEKYDGTNIMQYQYVTPTSQICFTYKTRLTPVAGNSELYGNFTQLVKEVVERDGLVPASCIRDGHVCNPVYELCGYRNPHMVKYNFDIKMIPICLVSQADGSMYPSSHRDVFCYYVNRFEDVGFESVDLTEVYEDSQQGDDEEIISSGTEEGNFPLEGKIFYVYSQLQGYVLVKCKPKTVEDIHFSRGGIANPVLKAVCLKALETYPVEEITLAKVNDLLLEDWLPEAVRVSEPKIVKAIWEMKEEAHFRHHIMLRIKESDLKEAPYDKGNLMRTLSPHFKPERMRQVYSSCKAMGLIGEDI